MTKSVCIASYNGSKYIALQISSVLPQLGKDDELIIVDDCSIDNTVEIISSFTDSRIKLYHNRKNLRHVKSFSKAISMARKELVFLCDQDDLWTDNRLALFEKYFIEQPTLQLISSKFQCIDDYGIEVPNTLATVKSEDSKNHFKNILSIFRGKIGYFGCAMAFRRSLLDKILPIPNYVEAHDLWIAMAGNLLKSNLHIDESTLYHRIHQNNASDLNRKTYRKLLSRIGFMKQYKELLKRIK